jgi:hypothetical protein
MRPFAKHAIFLALSMTALFVAAPLAVAGGVKTKTVCYRNSRGVKICKTEVVGGGTHSPAPPPHGGSPKGGGPSACSWNGQTVPCQDSTYGTFSAGCYYSVANPPISLVQPPPPADWESQPGYFIEKACIGPDGVVGSAGVSFFWTLTPPVAVPPSPRTLALRALASLVLPKPSPGRYPAGTLQNGDPYTVVNAYTWYWTSSTSFRTQSATASAAGVSSTVTVTPTALTFTPGDGSSQVSCSGPGTAWQSGDGVWAASPSGCDFRYLHSSIHSANHEVTATYGINWKVTWNSNNGQNGTLPNQTTTATTTFAVAEAESVVTH